MEKLSIKALAVAGGALWGVYMLLIAWSAWLFNWGTGFVTVMSSIYIGFTPTFLGGVIGAVWGFIDGAIAGAVIAWIYNIAAAKR
jgi:hypothetical protein